MLESGLIQGMQEEQEIGPSLAHTNKAKMEKNVMEIIIKLNISFESDDLHEFKRSQSGKLEK